MASLRHYGLRRHRKANRLAAVKLLLDNLPASLKSLRETLARCIEAFDSVTPVKQVILFGSHARGDAGPDSDVDLCIIADGSNAQRKTAAAYRHSIWQFRPLPSLTLLPITPARFQEKREIGDHFFATVLKEGVPLAAQD